MPLEPKQKSRLQAVAEAESNYGIVRQALEHGLDILAFGAQLAKAHGQPDGPAVKGLEARRKALEEIGAYEAEPAAFDLAAFMGRHGPALRGALRDFVGDLSHDLIHAEALQQRLGAQAARAGEAAEVVVLPRRKR